MNLKLVLLRGTTRVREVPLRGAEVVIGRAKDCGLRIAAHEVSRRHCRIRERGDKVTILDLGSVNGTFVNGQQVAEETMLLAGDQVLVGSVVFLVEPSQGRVASRTPRNIDSTPDADTLEVSVEQGFELVDEVQPVGPVEEIFDAELISPANLAEDELVPMDLVELVDVPPPATTPLPRADANVEALPRADAEELPRADVDEPQPGR